jgi:hypothetical protein
VDFVADNSNKLQKLGLKGKTSCALNVFNLPIFKNKVKNLGLWIQNKNFNNSNNDGRG